MNTLHFTGEEHHVQTPHYEINIFSEDQMLVDGKLAIIQIEIESEKIGKASFDFNTVEEISKIENTFYFTTEIAMDLKIHIMTL